MWIVRLALSRPCTFVVLSLILILTTPLMLRRTPTDIFPSIDVPVISVIWQYPGLNAQEIEQRMIYVHERSLSATVNDIEHVESNSYNGTGIIKVFLQPGASVDAGVAQTILKQMPQGQTPPLVIRYNASTVPILQYSLTSKTLSEQEIYDLAQNQFRVGLAVVRGAQLPWPYGGKTRVISVDLDLNALKAKNLSPQASTMEVVNRVKEELPKVIAALPKEIEVKQFVDESVFVKAAADGVVHKGKVELRSVQPGRDFGPITEILGGVCSDDQVILNPADSLVTGLTVRIAAPKEAPAA
ncbi:MAG: efflux RND transporter permease subunit [Verrucomicrobiota bacterium]